MVLYTRMIHFQVYFFEIEASYEQSLFYNLGLLSKIVQAPIDSLLLINSELAKFKCTL